MTVSTQTKNTEIFAFIFVLVLKLLTPKIPYKQKKTTETVKK